jgi:hypothetical protein
MVKSGSLVLPPEVITEIALNLMDDPELKDDVENMLGEFMIRQQKMAQAQMGGGAAAGAGPGARPMPPGPPAPAPIAA